MFLSRLFNKINNKKEKALSFLEPLLCTSAGFAGISLVNHNPYAELGIAIAFHVAVNMALNIFQKQSQNIRFYAAMPMLYFGGSRHGGYIKPSSMTMFMTITRLNITKPQSIKNIVRSFQAKVMPNS